MLIRRPLAPLPLPRMPWFAGLLAVACGPPQLRQRVAAGTTGDAASMKQATEALARNAAYRPQRIKFSDTRSPSRSDRPGSRATPAKAAGGAGTPPTTKGEVASSEREATARTVIRAVETQQRDERSAAERSRSELTSPARPTDLQLAQQQAQARKAEMDTRAQAASSGRYSAQRPADASVKVTATPPAQ